MSDLFDSTSPNSNVVEDNKIEGGAGGLSTRNACVNARKSVKSTVPFSFRSNKGSDDPKLCANWRKSTKPTFPLLSKSADWAWIESGMRRTIDAMM